MRLLELAVLEGFPAEWADKQMDEWLIEDEQISFIDWLYRKEAERGNGEG